MKLALTYTLLALIATAANIGAQELSLRIYHGDFSIWLSILVGTAVGLVIKYVLDKKYIFAFVCQNAKHEGSTFVLYTLMGVVTTVIFWGTEIAFDYYFQTKEMRYLGGVIGLGIGYVIKYHLDKKFVFINNSDT